MPTVYREHGMSFVIYTDDHPPPHVHVTGRGAARIALDPDIVLMEQRSLSIADVRRALRVVEAHRDMMLDVWNRIHG